MGYLAQIKRVDGVLCKFWEVVVLVQDLHHDSVHRL